MPVRLPESLIGAFIDNRDSIFSYRADELLQKRDVVEVNDDEPNYSRSRSSRSRGKKGKSKNARSKSVTIKSGDTLSEIAARHGTTVKKLKKLNKISGNSIRAGKKIKVK